MFYNDRVAQKTGITAMLCPACSAQQIHHTPTECLIDCIPETDLSRFIESHLQEAIKRYCEERSAKYNSLPEDIVKPEGLSVRVLLSEVGVVEEYQS